MLIFSMMSLDPATHLSTQVLCVSSLTIVDHLFTSLCMLFAILAEHCDTVLLAQLQRSRCREARRRGAPVPG